MNAVKIKEIRKQIKKSIDYTDDTTLQMINAMLEVSKKNAEANELSYKNEIERRIKEFEDGTAKTMTFEEIVDSARKSFKKRQQLK